MPNTTKTTSTAKTVIPPKVKEAFKQYMSGVPFTTVKARVKQPLMQPFQQLAGLTWKQLRAKRSATLRKNA